MTTTQSPSFLSIETDAIDASDVPEVGARELALALKMLSSGKGLMTPPALSDIDLRRVEQAFWEVSRRSRHRKVAVLLRFRSLVAAFETRRIAELVASHGEEAVIQAIAAAAKMRLNVKWGFNPHKLGWAIAEGLAATTAAIRNNAAAA